MCTARQGKPSDSSKKMKGLEKRRKMEQIDHWCVWHGRKVSGGLFLYQRVGVEGETLSEAQSLLGRHRSKSLRRKNNKGLQEIKWNYIIHSL